MLLDTKEEKVISIIVTYNPVIDMLTNNINTTLEQVDEVLIVNNSEYDINIKGYDDRVKIINNKTNLGISKALNIGITYAKKNNYKYVLLLDQDSLISEKFIEKMLEGFKSDEIAMICPNIVYIEGKNKLINKSNKFEEIDYGITSGSLLNINVLNKVKFKNNKYFNEDFFIDYVDFDFSLDIRRNGFKILMSNDVKLYHKLGESKEHKLWFIKFYPTNHNYIRRYYITRNRMFMWKKYFNINFKFVFKDMMYSIYEFILIVLFENDRVNKFKSIYRGIIDFLYNRVGEYNYDK